MEENKKSTLSDQIYQEIKTAITQSEFSPGEKLNIKELARKYGVSDTPVKQALQRLADERMVVNVPNKGMSVRVMTQHELNDIFDMRLMMDTFYLKDVLTTINYNQCLREQLIANLQKQKDFIARDESSRNPTEYFTLDMEFHTLYLTASGNQKAVEVLQFMQPFTYATGTYLSQPYFRDKECVEEHERILQAALAGDVEEMHTAVTTHIANSRRALRLIFKVSQMLPE